MTSLKHLLLIVTFLFTANVWAQAAGGDPPEKNIEVVLGIDSIEKLDFAPSTKIQIGNESILSYQLIPSKRELTFKGMKPGKTSVTVRNTVGDIKARYLVTVTASDQSKVVRELKDFLGDVEGLEIGVKGDYVYVGGRIVVPADIGKVVVILDKYPDVIRLVELSPQTQRIIAKKMQDEIQKNGLRDVTVRVVNNLFWLEGIVTNEPDKLRAEIIANAYVPDRIQTLAQRTDAVQTARKNIIQNFVQVNAKSKPEPVPKLIKITAQFVELTRDYNKIFGFTWTPTLGGDGGSINIGKGGGGVTTGSEGTLQATIGNLFPKLASAKSAGHARVIQSGVVVIKDGVQGVVKKNSSKKFALGTGEFTRADEAKSGFELTVKPKILQEEKIDLNMGISVSSSIGQPPEVLSNTINTNIVVKSKESAVVGGVVVNRSATDFDRNPPGGVDQVEGGQALFSFIKSKSYVSNRSQFVIFVTPEILESASQGTEEIKKKFRQRTR
ncbi:MAG: hypothetical protein EP326_10810 [Deltaproteobacteria bacterium]|nr:MAG: hypothetical protein EP326_10810 [Deltaproteobacteria bacterium]TNF31032.1 MAG: hypothetical protein EP319_03480 [Deltaproteobacteria bacterium]